MIRCEDCSARFGGWFTFRRHRPLTWTRCRTPEEMRAIGLHRNRRHVWVRRRPTFQGQIDFRANSRVRTWFGKPYRRLTLQERREYRGRLALDTGTDELSRAVLTDLRNAQGQSETAGRGAA